MRRFNLKIKQNHSSKCYGEIGCGKLEVLPAFLILVVLLLSINLYVETGHAKPESPAFVRAQFGRALSYFREGQLERAQSELNRLISNTRGNNYITSGYLLSAAVAEKLGDYKLAERYLQLLLRNFPYSRYVDHAYFSLARLSYKDGRMGDAIHNLLCVIERDKQAKLVQLCESIGCKIVASGVEASELEKLFAFHPTSISQQWLSYWMIRCRMGTGRRAEAEALAQKFLAEKPEARFVRLTQELLNRPLEELTYPVRIGIIMPLTGYAGKEGTDFIKGMAFALKNQPVKIELFVRDSKSNLNEAIKNMQELLKRNITFFIGEMDGNISSALAALAAAANRPFLVPLATDNGIASLGSQVFQMNGDLEMRGYSLAKYAFEKLNLRTFATLSPADEYGQAVTDAFTKTIDAMGGVIVAQQWYYSGAQDFQRQFFAIRQSALRFSPRDLSAVADYQDSLQQETSREAPEVIYSYKPHRETVEDFEIPIHSIDAIFLPIYEEDISSIAPQLALANIKAVPLGGEGWFNANLLRAQRRYIDGIIFFTGKFVSDISLDYIQFKNKYRTITNTSPSIMSVYGYDLMQLLITAVQGGNISSEDIVIYLKGIKTFRALGGDYTFTANNRVNSSVNILQYVNGNISKVAP